MRLVLAVLVGLWLLGCVECGTLCSVCTCLRVGIVNCADRELETFPVITESDRAIVGTRSIGSFRGNKDLCVDNKTMLTYINIFDTLEFDDGVVCLKMAELSMDTQLRVIGCTPLPIYETTRPSQRNETARVGVTANVIQAAERMSQKLASMYDKWLINVILGWIGMFVNGVATTLVLDAFTSPATVILCACTLSKDVNTAIAD